MRVRAYPLSPDIEAFVLRHQRVYVVEQNRDGQLCGLMRLEFEAAAIAKLRGIRHFDGLPIDARTITDGILAQEGHEMASSVG
jgi:2-oxoglutarate ferredoxin oxidoreductase subunit alpha